MRLLIDTEVILYRNLFGLKDSWYYHQIRSCDNYLEKIMDRFDTTDITLFLSGANNFRYKIYPLYKSNRKDSERPRYLHDAKNYFLKYWNAVCADGLEADDLIAMNHDEDSIIVSTDKDFNQLPGNQYNPVTDTLYFIDNPAFHFYKQLLTGDVTDSVPGVLNPAKAHHKIPPNFTEKTASETLLGKTKSEMNTLVREMYEKEFGDRWFEVYDRNAQLLFLKRSENSSYNDFF